MFCFDSDDNENFIMCCGRRSNFSSAGAQAVTHSERLKKKQVALAAANLVFGPLGFSFSSLNAATLENHSVSVSADISEAVSSWKDVQFLTLCHVISAAKELLFHLVTQWIDWPKCCYLHFDRSHVLEKNWGTLFAKTKNWMKMLQAKCCEATTKTVTDGNS